MCIRDSYDGAELHEERRLPDSGHPVVGAGTEAQMCIRDRKKASPLPMIMLLLFVIGAAGVGGYLYVKMKGVKPASKKNNILLNMQKSRYY